MDCGLRAGEVVHLRSGGPSMTVEEVFADSALCSWREKGRPKAATFRCASLAKGPGQDPSFS